MNVVIILIPVGLLVAGAFLSAFIWALNSGQFDDLETPAHRILFDDDTHARRTARDLHETQDSAQENRERT
jgi:cbb3-type cytochrome oxidase maturation protein